MMTRANVKIISIDSTAEVEELLTLSGGISPEIPDGCNTITEHVTLHDGRFALVIAQCGFFPDDREAPGEEVDGLAMLIVADDSNEELARAALNGLYEELLRVKN